MNGIALDEMAVCARVRPSQVYINIGMRFEPNYSTKENEEPDSTGAKLMNPYAKGLLADNQAISIDRWASLRSVSELCVFGVAYYFAYRYGMSFSQATASPFWFPDSVLLCALLLVQPARWWVFVFATLPIRLLAPVSAG